MSLSFYLKTIKIILQYVRDYIKENVLSFECSNSLLLLFIIIYTNEIESALKLLIKLYIL